MAWKIEIPARARVEFSTSLPGRMSAEKMREIAFRYLGEIQWSRRGFGANHKNFVCRFLFRSICILFCLF